MFIRRAPPSVCRRNRRRRKLTDVPADLDQTFSSVREALGELMQGAAQLGVVLVLGPDAETSGGGILSRDPGGDINKIYAEIVKTAPALKQAEAKLMQAQRDLDQAKLNLRYCTIVAEIDGVVTRRNVNPGNNVQVGQSLMASVRCATSGSMRISRKRNCAICGSASRRDRSGHVRQQAEIQGPHLRLHYGHRLDAGAAAAAECDRQFRESRAASAGADRSDGLRSGQGAAVRWAFGDADRSTYGASRAGPNAGKVSAADDPAIRRRQQRLRPPAKR